MLCHSCLALRSIRDDDDAFYFLLFWKIGPAAAREKSILMLPRSLTHTHGERMKSSSPPILFTFFYRELCFSLWPPLRKTSQIQSQKGGGWRRVCVERKDLQRRKWTSRSRKSRSVAGREDLGLARLFSKFNTHVHTQQIGGQEVLLPGSPSFFFLLHRRERKSPRKPRMCGDFLNEPTEATSQYTHTHKVKI